jgi:filamin
MMFNARSCSTPAVDASRAGEGQLEISVNRGAVPNTARVVSKGVFAVTFTPKEAKIHNVEITFNEELCKCQ